MSTSVLYMSMSLDGYIAGPNDEPDNPGGDGFDRCAQRLVVDLVPIFGQPPKPEFLLDNGLHPSLAGHQAIAKALIERLTA